MPENVIAYQPGFRGTETSGSILAIYPQESDPIVIKGGRKLNQDSAYGANPERSDFSLVSISTTKAMGQGSGSWQAEIKANRGSRAESNIESITDDDWVDIEFYRNAKPWHVMRGLVDSMRVIEKVGSNGVTSRSYVLAGRDFASIFERTQVFFNPYHNELGGSISLKVFGGATNVFGNPTRVVNGFLYSFLSELGNLKRAVWRMPVGIPGIGGTRFVENIVYDDSNFTNNPERIAVSPSMMMPQGTIWKLAQEWSDPAFCELFCDTTTSVDPTTLSSLPIKNSSMRVIFRDKPLPLSRNADYPKSGLASAYFSLPLHEIPLQFVISSNIGKTGLERFNSFFAAPQMAQENFNAGAIDLAKPLWNDGEILSHGLRRFDIQTRYNSSNAEILILAERQRTFIRDWHSMNPYLWDGTINLGRGFPEIRIGDRVRIISDKKPFRTFYVEQVSHSWRFGSSIKTSLGVTRGWEGDDNSYMDALSEITEGYQQVVMRDTPGTENLA